MNLEIAKHQTPKNQIDSVIYHLKYYGKLTSLHAFKYYGIQRLAGYIHTLRNNGMEIVTHSITKKNSFGNPVTFGEYELIAKPKQSQLNF